MYRRTKKLSKPILERNILLLKVSDLDVYYQNIKALSKVSLRVDKGEKVCIIGSNGAGKTTLLKAISGLLNKRSGRIEFLGERIDNMPPNKIVEKGLSLIPEGRELFSKMSVLENLELGAYPKRARRDLEKNLAIAFQLFPILRERKNQSAGTLSGGEQQMLAIARGLLSAPKLLMFDEPSLGLAPTLVTRMFQTIEEISERGITILLVEQNVVNSLAIADRAYVLENGRISLEGSGSDLLNNKAVKEAYLGM